MKRYKLLKDLPAFRAGHIMYGEPNGEICLILKIDTTRCTEWFEEVKTIPANQAWVTTHIKYVNKEWIGDGWFMPTYYNYEDMVWSGLYNNEKPANYKMDVQEIWEDWKEREEVKEPEKPKRKAPAYVRSGESWSSWDISCSLFESEEEAMNEFRDGYVISWPALPDSEGYYPGPKGEG